jgi:hypothetical protein
VNISHTRQSAFPGRSDNALTVFDALAVLAERWLDQTRSTVVATWRHATASDAELNMAKRNLRHAKRVLLEAESRFDRECRLNPAPLIGAIKAAEARIQVSRAALLQIDPWSTE